MNEIEFNPNRYYSDPLKKIQNKFKSNHFQTRNANQNNSLNRQNILYPNGKLQYFIRRSIHKTLLSLLLLRTTG